MKFTINTQQFPFIIRDFDFYFIKENEYIAVCPVLEHISYTYGLKTVKSFFDYERVTGNKDLMDELFSILNRGYRRERIEDKSGNNIETINYTYYLGRSPKQTDFGEFPIPMDQLPKFTPLYYKLSKLDYELIEDQAINRKKNGIYFVHPTLFQAICCWADSRYAVKAFEVVHAYNKCKGDMLIMELRRNHEEAMAKMDRDHEETKKQHEETKSILISTKDNLEELRIEHEDTSFKLVT